MTHPLKAVAPQEILMRNHHHHLIAVDGHADLHSEHGPNRGEHSGRSVNPTIKVTDLAWLEFEKPDLDRAETFARAFGFAVAGRDPKTLHLRGSLPGAPAVVIRKGARSRFIGPTFKAADASDLHTLAWANNRRVEPLDEPGEGSIVRLRDPSGIAVGVYHGRHDLPALAGVRAELHRYFGLPFYRTMFRAAGFAADVAAYDDAAPDVDAQKQAISERFIDHLCAIGDEAAVRLGVQRYRDAGVTNPIVTAISGTDFDLTLRSAAGRQSSLT